MQYILLFANLIKCIAHTTVNHIMYDIFYFLLVPAKIKCTRAAPLYILFLAGTSKKSKMLYIIYSKMFFSDLSLGVWSVYLLHFFFLETRLKGIERKSSMVNIPLLQYCLVVMEAYQNTTDCTYGTYGGISQGRKPHFLLLLT